jgi:Fic family protein
MPRGQGTIRPPSRASDEAVKPTPPDDLWDKLDALQEHFARPIGTFTLNEYQQRFGLKPSTAGRRLKELLKLGKVERVGKWWRLL